MMRVIRSFSSGAAARLARLNPADLRCLQEVIPPSQGARYSFADVSALRAAGTLLRAGAAPASIVRRGGAVRVRMRTRQPVSRTSEEHRALALGAAERGVELAGSKLWEKSREAFREAVAFDASLSIAWHNLAHVELHLGEYAAAIVSVEAAIAHAEAGAEFLETAYHNLATALDMAGDRGRAIRAWQRCLGGPSDKVARRRIRVLKGSTTDVVPGLSSVPTPRRRMEE